MRVNMGCGPNYAEGWYNVDAYIGVKSDLIADIVTLDMPDASVAEVYLGHVLEHLEIDEIPHTLLNVQRMLEPGGWVCAVGPDLNKVDQLADPVLWEMLHKGGEPGRHDPYITHKWECTEERLLYLMREVFPTATAIEVGTVAPQFPLVSDVHWQCAVLARKPTW